MPGDTAAVPCITLCALPRAAAERPTAPPTCVEWGVLNRSDSVRLFWVSMVIAEIVDGPGERQYRALRFQI